METEITKEIGKVLPVRELLENTYEKLGERNSHSEIILPRKVESEIANDSDWHRIRTGEMGYDKARFFTFNNKSWLIGNGKSCGQYPARPYDSDILALELAVHESPSEVYKQFQKNIGSYFKNSLIHGMGDGRLATVENRFAEKMMGLLKPKIEDFIAEMSKYNNEILSVDDLQPINISPMKYKPEFADFLAEAIETVLSRS